MSFGNGICAVVPLKDTSEAKQRLAGVLDLAQRRQLALAMFEQVLTTLGSMRELAGIRVVTVDPVGCDIASRHGAQVSDEAARDGHTGAVAAAAQRLAAEGFGLLTLPGDIPLVRRADIAAAACRPSRGARVHDRAGARPARLQCGPLHAGRRGAAALR